MLLLLQFLFDHPDFFFPDKLGIYIMPPCNKARISIFQLDFQEFQEFQISLKRYSSFTIAFSHMQSQSTNLI